MLKQLIIVSAVSAAFTVSAVHAQQSSRDGANTQSSSATLGTQGSGTGMSKNQDAPSGGVGQVFPAEGKSGSGSGSSGGTGTGTSIDSTASGSSGGTSGTGQSADSSGNQTESKGASSGQRQTNAQDSGKGQGNANAPVYLLVPVDVASNDNALKNGCWARIYSRENYAGDSLTIVGPSTLADMDRSGLFGLNWDDRVSSIELGPKATMTVYDNENFRDLVGQFKPGQRVPDIDKRTGFFDEFSSVRLDCQKT